MSMWSRPRTLRPCGPHVTLAQWCSTWQNTSGWTLFFCTLSAITSQFFCCDFDRFLLTTHKKDIHFVLWEYLGVLGNNMQTFANLIKDVSQVTHILPPYIHVSCHINYSIDMLIWPDVWISKFLTNLTKSQTLSHEGNTFQNNYSAAHTQHLLTRIRCLTRHMTVWFQTEWCWWLGAIV